MPYRRLRKRHWHINSYYRKPMPRGQRLLMFFFILFLALLASALIILNQMKPYLYKAAETRVTDVLLIEVNSVIEAEMLKGSFDYTKLVNLEKDAGGNITALVTNTVMINTLQAKVSNGVFDRVQDEVITDMEIPIGNVIGGVLFIGRGPAFKVNVLTIADVNTKFSDSFESAGVNQTRHRIYLDIWVDVEIMIPGYQSETLTISNQVAIAETVIVGKTPNIYATIGENP